MNSEQQVIKYLDLKAVNAPYEEEIKTEMAKVIESGWYLMGEAVKRFETAYAQHIGTKHCIACGNGLDALKLILMGEMALNRLHRGDEVIVPANTYIATILAITSVGLIPVLVEPSKATMQIDDTLIESHITEKTKAIMAVHLYGRLSITKSIIDLCNKHNLLLFEDNAQAFNCMGEYAKEQANSHIKEQIDRYAIRQQHFHHTGALGDAAAHSFYPGKNLGALGDAGAVTTNDDELANVITALHNYGSGQKYVFDYLGINSRMDELQAAALNVKLRHPNEEQQARTKIAQRYIEELKPEIVEKCIPTKMYDDVRKNVIHIFPFLTSRRDELKEYLAEHHIGTVIHYPIPPHKQRCYPKWNQLSLPVTEQLSKQEISLPCNSALTEGEQDKIIQLINEFF